MFLGITPVRISFAGGGTDMPEYFNKFGGHVISSTINLFTYVIIKPRRDKSFHTFSSDFEIHQSAKIYESLKAKPGNELVISTTQFLKYKNGADFLTWSDVPPGSGLGASSSLAINLVNSISTIQGKKWNNNKIAETAFDIERNTLKHPIGKQDDYVASFGGLNYIRFTKKFTKVTPLNMNPTLLKTLEKNLMLFFVGTTRNSSKILSRQLRSTKEMNTTTINALHAAKEIADDLHSSLKKSDITRFGEILHKGWLIKKKFATGVSNRKIDKIYSLALKSGAIGGKLTGAGGGGHLLLYCEPRRQKILLNKLKQLGLTHIPFSFYLGGPKTVNLYDLIKS